MRARSLSRITRIIFGLLATLAILASALVWLVGTDTALQWGVKQIEARSEEQVSLHEVSGSLFGPLRVGKFSVRNEHTLVEADEVVLDWSWRPLTRKHLQISRLSARELRVSELAPSSELLSLPDSLHLPFTFSAPAITLDRLTVNMGDKDLVLTGIDLAAEQNAGSFRLTVRSLDSPWGALRGDARLGDAQPFDLHAKIDLLQKGTYAYGVQALVAGTLTKATIDATAQALGNELTLRALVAPLDPMPLISGHLAAAHLDPAKIREGLPTADVDVELSLIRQAGHGAIPDHSRFSGHVRVVNALPGRWNQTRWPLRELTSEFSGMLDEVRLNNLVIDLADAGRLTGDGRFADRALRLTLATDRLDPQGLHSKLRPLKLAGDITLDANDAGQQIMVDLHTTSLRGYRLRLDALRREQRIELREIRVAAGNGRLNANGSLHLDNPLPFQVSGQLHDFNPADFGEFPAARVNAEFSSAGQLSEPQARVEFSLGHSEFRKQALAGHGTLRVSDRRLWDADVALKLARNTLNVRGALGASNDRLDVQIDAVDLSSIDPGLGGQVHLSGTLEGGFTAPTGAVRVDAKNMVWQKSYRIGTLTVNARMGKGVDGEIALESSINGLVAPLLQLNQATLDAQGTRASHRVQWHAKNQNLDLTGRLTGGWREVTGWAGQLVELVNHGTHGFSLTSPTALAVAPQRVTVGRTHVKFAGVAAGTELILDHFAYDAGKISSGGEFKGFPLAYAENFTRGVGDMTTDLTFGGRWRFTVGERADGTVSIWREGGDLSYSQSPKIPLGLTHLAFDATAIDGRVQLSVGADGTQLGHFKAEAQSQLSSHEGVWGLASDAPVQASAELAIKSLAWLQPLVSSAVVFDGALQAQVRLDGPLSRPALSGSIDGDRFTVALPEQGLSLHDGRLRASLDGQSIRLNDLSLRGGNGTLSATGQASLDGGSPTLKLTLKAERLEAISRPDRHLVVSGGGTLSVVDTAIRLGAKIVADDGLIELPRADTPTLSDDVVILGAPNVAKPRGVPYHLDVDLDVDLGKKFFVKGKGLDAQIAGSLALTGANGALPSSRGSIRVVKGAYSAYGQRLDITRGFLNFQGPLDNPGLNLVAMRTDQAVEAGVLVSGTAQSPQVRLISSPSVPDSEKLSWLVLGHGAEGSSAQEFSVLQAAASALLDAGQSVTMQQRIAQAAGLEDVSLKGSGGLENTVLSLGKRLSSRAFVTYEQGLSNAGTLVKINYTLSKRLSVRAQTGVSSALDLFYTFSFD